MDFVQDFATSDRISAAIVVAIEEDTQSRN